MLRCSFRTPAAPRYQEPAAVNLAPDPFGSLLEPATLLAAVDALEAAALPAFLATLAGVQARVAARLASASQRPSDGPDRLLSVKDAAPILGMSADWLYRNADRLPFTRRTGRRDAAVLRARAEAVPGRSRGLTGQ